MSEVAKKAEAGLPSNDVLDILSAHQGEGLSVEHCLLS